MTFFLKIKLYFAVLSGYTEIKNAFFLKSSDGCGLILKKFAAKLESTKN